MMQPFGELFPQLAQDECRVIWLPDAPERSDDIPADGYALVEFYCNDRKCDCRRVMLNLVRESTGQLVGVVSYGLCPDATPVGPFLDPLHPRAKYAHLLLELVDDLVLSDTRYVERLRRHYAMFKAEINGKHVPGKLTAEEVARRIDERKKRTRALRRAQERKRR
jgi:hypothetical protein